MIEIKSIEEGNKLIRDLNYKLLDIMNDILSIHSQQWEMLYKDRCPENYLSFEDFINEMIFWNKNGIEYSYELDQLEERLKYSQYAITLINILQDFRDHNFTQIPDKVVKMTCEACAGNGCPYMKDCLGHTCDDCRKAGYTMYEGYCDE